jgi:large subunit ribosomal protein L23
MVENKNSFYDILRTPVLSEKSMKMSEFNKYVFKVRPSATKEQVKKAIENIFEVKIVKINSLTTEGKTKVFKGMKGKRKDYKKIIVTLEKGNTIDFNAGIK